MSGGSDPRPPIEPTADPAREVAPQDAAAATTGASVLGGGIWQLASRLWPQAATLILSVAAARFLGPDDFGRQSFIAFVSICAITFLSGGLSVAVMRYIAELLGRDQMAAVPGLVRWGLSIQLGAAVVGGGALVVTGMLGAIPQLAWILAGVATAISIAQTIPNAVLIGTQRFRQESIIGLVTDSIGLPLTIGVLAAGGGIAGIFGAQAAVAAMNLVWTSFAARSTVRERAPSDEPRPDLWRGPLTRFAIYNTLIGLLTLVVWRRSEFFFLDAYSTDAEIGLYSIAFATAAALALVPETLASVMAPAFATLFGAGRRDRMVSGFGRGMRILLALSLPLTTAAVALVPTLIEVMYGSDFAASGDVFLVMVALFPLLPIYQVCFAVLTGMGRAAIPLILGVGAAVLNIGLDFLLIPDLEAIGAALATTLSQIAVIVPVVVYTIHLTGRVRLDPGTLARGAIASVAAGGAGFASVEALGGLAGLVVGSAAWLVVFGGLAVTLGVLSRDDARWIDETAGRRARGLIGRLARALSR